MVTTLATRHVVKGDATNGGEIWASTLEFNGKKWEFSIKTMGLHQAKIGIRDDSMIILSLFSCETKISVSIWGLPVNLYQPCGYCGESRVTERVSTALTWWYST